MNTEHETAPAIPEQPQMSAAEYARSRYAVWMSAAALFTDPLGARMSAPFAPARAPPAPPARPDPAHQ